MKSRKSQDEAYKNDPLVTYRFIFENPTLDHEAGSLIDDMTGHRFQGDKVSKVTLRYRCVEWRGATKCPASFYVSVNYRTYRKYNDKHNHDPPQKEF